jgi:hypothetical protein
MYIITRLENIIERGVEDSPGRGVICFDKFQNFQIIKILHSVICISYQIPLKSLNKYSLALSSARRVRLICSAR